MSDDAKRIARRLEQEGDRTAAFFESLSQEDWDRRVYAEGSGWRVREVLAHFVSAEAAYLRFLRQSLAGGPGLPSEFDIDAFNKAEVPRYVGQNPEALLRGYRAGRSQMVELAGSFSPEDLEREGYHPWFGVMKLSWYLRLCYNHNSMHLRDVRRALARAEPIDSI